MVSLKHAKVSTLVDSPDETLIRPSDWNDEHVLELSAGDRLLGRADTPGVVQEIAVGDGLDFAVAGLSVKIDTDKGLAFSAGEILINIGSGLEFGVGGELKTSPVAAPDGIASGAVVAFASNTAPTGWLKANGAAVSRTTYAALFAAIGTTFGAGNGSTTFNLPDLRGEFVRGWDDARGVDSGRAFGSAQADDNKSHTHTGSTNTAGAHSHTCPLESSGSGIGAAYNGRASANYPTSTAGAHAHSLVIDAAGGAEARPRNVALLYCIKT